MSKRILFLYCTEKDKEKLLLCEKVMRATLHKFRKSALFSYVQIDTSLSCREDMRKILISESDFRDAVFMEADKRMISSCDTLINEVFTTFATEHGTMGRVVFYPESVHTESDDNDSISQVNSYSRETIRKTVRLALDCAKKRKHILTICTQPANSFDELFLRETEFSFCEEKHISAENIFLDEMIHRCTRTVPDFDVIFTKKEYAPFITMHLNSVPSIPTGYVIKHCENLKVYRRQILPHEEISGFEIVSSLLSLAEIFENEFDMKNAAAWLRRAISTTASIGFSYSPEELANRVIEHVNLPIRKRRTEQNEN